MCNCACMCLNRELVSKYGTYKDTELPQVHFLCLHGLQQSALDDNDNSDNNDSDHIFCSPEHRFVERVCVCV